MAHDDTVRPTAKEMIDFYISAEQMVLQGQVVRMDDGSTLTMANIEQIRAGRQEWTQIWNEEQRALAGQSIGVKARWSNQ